MGTFENIRRISPYFFAAFAVTLVAFFTIGDQTVVDGLTSRGMNPQTREIGSVNGSPIYLTEFDELVQRQKQLQMQQSQDPNLVIDDARVRTQIWNDMVEKLLLKQEAEKAGIIVTNEEIIDVMLVNPPDYLKQGFKDSAGVFQKDVYTRLLTDPEGFFREMMPDQDPAERDREIQKFRNEILEIQDYILQEKIRNNITSVVGLSGSVISNLYARQKYIMDNSTANVDILSISLSDLEPEPMRIADEDIQKYYEKNKKYFSQKEQRNAKYISIPLVPSKDDSVRAQRRVESIMSAMQGLQTPRERDSVFEIKMSEYGGETHDFQLINEIDQQIYSYLVFLEEGNIAGPVLKHDGTYFYRLDGRREGENELVKASHILINFDNNKDSARTVANDILRKAKAGDDFAMLARNYSKDPGSGAQGGDLGYFGRGQMVPEFEQAAFSMQPNQISNLVESQFGFHIIKLIDKQTQELAYSSIRIAPLISGPTKNGLFMKANQIADEIKAGKDIDSVAVSYDLMATEIPFFERNRPVLNSNYLGSLAFNAKIGDILPVDEYGQYGIVVMQITEERKKGVASLDAVKSEISQKLAQQQQLDRAKEKAAEIYQKVKNYSNLQEALEHEPELKIRNIPSLKHNENIQGLGREPVLASKIFEVPLNKMSEPIRGESGYYVIYVNERNTPEETTIETELTNYTDRLRLTARNTVFNQWFNKIKENADIKDYRSEYFRDY